MTEKLTYLGLILAAVGFAFGFPKEQRWSAIVLAIAVLADWLLIEFTYTAYSPHLWFKAHGHPLEARQLWAGLDFLVGAVAISLAWRWWFGWAVWGVVIFQQIVYVERDNGLTSPDFLWLLDKSLLAIIAVFVVGGSGGVKDGIYSAFDRLRSRSGTVSQVHQKALSDD